MSVVPFVIFFAVFVPIMKKVKEGVRTASENAKKAVDENYSRAANDAERQRTSASKSGMTAEEWYDGVQKRRQEVLTNVGKKTVIEAELEKTSREDHHHHPSKTKNTQVEYVPTSGSLPVENAEGCDELRNVRFVETDDDDADIDLEHELTPLQAMMVFGEVIQKPKFKK